eukprot:7563239-Ditylum_brightwellii.AAC.1
MKLTTSEATLSLLSGGTVHAQARLNKIPQGIIIDWRPVRVFIIGENDHRFKDHPMYEGILGRIRMGKEITDYIK